MGNLEELRYPFDTMFEFVAYWRDPAAFHLDFAWVVAILLIVRVLASRVQSGQKLLALYFGLTMFNNPAFQVLPGSSLGDIFGVLCVLYYLVIARHGPVRISPIGLSLCAAALLMSLHAMAIGAFYPELNQESDGLIRFIVLAKIVVLGLCCCLFDHVFSRTEDIQRLIHTVVSFAVVGLIAYLIQVVMLLSGHMPFGTYFDAGFIGVPSFGSVSIERGHFGKAMTPLFPLFLMALLAERRRLVFALFIGVTLINFSASSLAFFAVYVCLALFYFRERLNNVKVFALICMAMLAVGVFIAMTWDLWAGVITKINALAFEGEEGGGRGIGTFLAYLDRYPFGISYSGSSLRTAPGMDEINMGIFAFVTQFSLLAGPLAIAFLILLFYVARCTRSVADHDLARAMKIGILAMPFIFAADILWFVPTIWLPVFIACRAGHLTHERRTPRPRSGYSPSPLYSRSEVQSPST